MRASKIPDILQILSVNTGGWLWSDLEGHHKFIERVDGKIECRKIYLPRKTLDRNLKQLIKKGIVEKTIKKTGKRERPAGRYKIAANRKPCIQIPVRWHNNVWFPGKRIGGYHGSEEYGAHIRLTGEQKKDYEKMILLSKQC